MRTTGKFTLTADDLANAARLYSWSGLTRPKTLLVWAVLWVLGNLVLARLFIGSRPLTLEALLPHAPIFLVVTFLPFIAIFAIVMIVNPIGARRQYAQQRSLRAEIAIGWTDEALRIDSEYGPVSMPWDHFLSWAEDKHTFLLFESARLYRVIPKRVLTPEQQASLRQLLPRIGG